MRFVLKRLKRSELRMHLGPGTPEKDDLGAGGVRRICGLEGPGLKGDVDRGRRAHGSIVDSVA